MPRRTQHSHRPRICCPNPQGAIQYARPPVIALFGFGKRLRFPGRTFDTTTSDFRPYLAAACRFRTNTHCADAIVLQLLGCAWPTLGSGTTTLVLERANSSSTEAAKATTTTSIPKLSAWLNVAKFRVSTLHGPIETLETPDQGLPLSACYAPTSMPSVPSGCTFNSYTKRRDGCTGYYVHCPNARPRGQCPAVRQTINIPADCSLKQYRGADGCLYLIQDCDGGSGSSSPPVGLTISG